MAFTYGFYNSINHDRLYDAEQISSIFDGVILDGVFGTWMDGTGTRTTDRFQVTAATDSSGAALMKVNVAPGKAWFNHTWNYNDSKMTLDLPTGNIALPRYDGVFIKVNRTIQDSTGGECRTNSIVVVSGEPNTAPKIPTPTETEFIFYHALAYIYVAAGATTITDACITNVVTNVNTDSSGYPVKTTIKPINYTYDSSYWPEVTPIVMAPIKTLDATILVQDWRSQFETLLNTDKANFESWWNGIKNFFAGTDPTDTIASTLAQLVTQLTDLNDFRYAFSIASQIKLKCNYVSTIPDTGNDHELYRLTSGGDMYMYPSGIKKKVQNIWNKLEPHYYIVTRYKGNLLYELASSTSSPYGDLIHDRIYKYSETIETIPSIAEVFSSFSALNNATKTVGSYYEVSNDETTYCNSMTTIYKYTSDGLVFYGDLKISSDRISESFNTKADLVAAESRLTVNNYYLILTDDGNGTGANSVYKYISGGGLPACDFLDTSGEIHAINKKFIEYQVNFDYSSITQGMMVYYQTISLTQYQSLDSSIKNSGLLIPVYIES